MTKIKIAKISSLYSKFKENILDLIFPRFCVGCQTEGEWLCPKCQEKIVVVVSSICPDCGRLERGGKYCQKCQKKKSLEGIIVSAYYEEGPLKEAVHNFKYNSVKELGPVLANLMLKALKNNSLGKIDYLTWVPLHSRRLAQRGYNQAEVLCQELAKKLDVGALNLLCKKKNTQRQVRLKGSERRKNLSGVFQIHKKVNLKGKRIVLVDDITTTGTTLNECAKVLKQAGAKEVWGLVLAKG